MVTAERALVWLLRLSGVVMLLAVGAIFLPVSWMAATHRWLGLGEFPAGPIVDYLARSASALYAVYGGLLLLVSWDVRRHARVIAYLAWTGLVFGVVILGIDIHAGMPALWVAGEGPSILILSVLLLGLLRLALRE